MSSLDNALNRKALVETCPKEWLVTEDALILDLDLVTDNLEDCSFSSLFELRANSEG